MQRPIASVLAASILGLAVPAAASAQDISRWMGRWASAPANCAGGGYDMEGGTPSRESLSLKVDGNVIERVGGYEFSPSIMARC